MHGDPLKLTFDISAAIAAGASESALTAASAIRLTQSNAFVANSPGGSNGAAGSSTAA